jgi:hypothetical protein
MTFNQFNMRKIILVFAIFATGMVSCKKNLLDINEDPNRATFSTPQLTMPLALEGAGRVTQRAFMGNISMWIGYHATPSGFSKPNETYTYDISNTYLSGLWDDLYNNIADFDYIEKKALEQNLPVYRAIAKVMKAYDFHQLVDLWGNVPYSEALKGDKNIAPKYDDGKLIYDDLIKQIDSAILIFKLPSTAGTVSVATDKAKIILFGNLLTSASAIPTFITRWVKFSNSLKLQLLMNQTKVPGRSAYITQELAGLTRADFLDLGEDALQNPGYQNVTGKFNPFYGLFYSSVGTLSDTYKSVKASDYGVKEYLRLNDPRISFYYDKGAAPAYIGSIFGDPTGVVGANIGTGLLVPDAPATIFTATESLFLQAEAVQRGFMAGNAKQLYQDAVLASFQFDKVPNAAAAAATYLAQADPDVNWDLATDKIKIIITQKWFALNSINVLSVYNDYRRTGYPNVPLSTDASSKGKIPRRLIYPQRESLVNSTNVAAQGTIDPLNSKVFWDL